MIQLPEAIKAYIEASNAEDIDAIVACFTADAEIKDDHKTYTGTDEITSWAADTINKYHSRLTPTKLANTDPDVIVTAQVTGTFDGKAEMEFTFSLENEKIANLEIH